MNQSRFLQWMTILAMGLIGWMFFPFLKSFFVAVLLAMATSPIHRSMERKLSRIGWLSSLSPFIAAGLVSAALSLIIFLPLSVFLFQLFDHPGDTMNMIRSAVNRLENIAAYLPSYLSWLQIPLDTMMHQARLHQESIIAYVAQWFGNGLTTFMAMLGEMAMVIVWFFFLSWYGRSIILFLLPIVPVSRTIKREFLGDMMTTTAVVFFTFMGVMIAQGLAFGIFIAFFEGYNPLMLGFLTGISAIIPVVGTALVWVPVAVNEYMEGHIFNAVVISLYSWAMMAFFIDNIVKLVILNFVNRSLSSGKSRINEFVIFFAIVGGLATFGFWGFILGPAVVAFGVTTLRIQRRLNRMPVP
ncbi:MAG: AI-2E family transporter [Sulfuricurvum sp.]